MIACCAIFAIQDAISRHLGEAVNVYMVVMIRFWFFAAFVMLMALRTAGQQESADVPAKSSMFARLKTAVTTAHPIAQIIRGLLLVSEIVVIVIGFTKLGLIGSHAVFVCYPLLVSALSGPILGEKVGWRRWAAVIVGFIGVLIILKPGSSVFSPWAIMPFAAAMMFATYSLLTRFVAAKDSASVSFFWAGIIGAMAITPLGLMHWEPMSAENWGWLGLLCLASMSSHWLLIKAYDVAEASEIQPFAYFQLPFAAILGLVLFDESIEANLMIGAAIVVAAGLFTLWRQKVNQRRKAGA